MNDSTPSQVAKVMRAFVRDRRLLSIPASRSKRRIVLDLIAQDFEPGVRYPERQVNEMLAAWHPDHAALRRYLVEEELLERRRNVYWRAGGTFEV